MDERERERVSGGGVDVGREIRHAKNKIITTKKRSSLFFVVVKPSLELKENEHKIERHI